MAELQELAGDRADLLAQVAGLLTGFHEGELDEAKALRSVRDFARKEWPLRGSPADVSGTGALRSAGGR
jgi:hypothetical protein